MARPIRETYQCENCKASLRERVTASGILAAYGKAGVRSLAELVQLSSFFNLSIYEPGVAGAYRKFFKSLPKYQNSFFWEGGTPGEDMYGVRHEDLMKLTFPSSSFDLVVSSDIFEHIRRPWVAFREVARVLKPGGMHIFSIPALLPMQKSTVYRVDTSSSEDVHILEPYFHGDGRGGKSLVYVDYGRDIFEKLEEFGFRTLTTVDDHVDLERRRVISFISIKM